MYNKQYFISSSSVRNDDLHIKLQALLEETDNAFRQYVRSGGSMGADYGEFAAQSLTSFRRMLRNPHLTREDLAMALRKCCRLRTAAEEAGIPWTSLAAACLAGQSNFFGTVL